MSRITIKNDKSAIMLGRTATSSIAHVFENNNFGVGENVNFITEPNFILMNKKKITTLSQKIIF